MLSLLADVGFFPLTTIIVVFVIFFGLTIGISVFLIIRNSKKTEERLSRLSEIDYTQIIGSSGGNNGTVYTHGNNGTNIGTYSSPPTTKFLVVYLNGEREIVSVRDNSRLCDEYLLRLKKDD